jgi:hypothetical protein
MWAALRGVAVAVLVTVSLGGSSAASTPVHPAEAPVGPDGGFPLVERPAHLRVRVGDRSAVLTWDEPADRYEDTAGYRIYRNGTLVAEVGPSTETWIDRGLTNGGTVTYAVARLGVTEGEGLTTLSRGGTPAPPNRFDDVPPSLDSAVNALTFDPQGPEVAIAPRRGARFVPGVSLRRSELASMLFRVVGRPAVSRPHGLTDVPAELGPVVRWAVHDPDGSGPLGAPLPGSAGRRFRPTTPVTMAQAFRALYHVGGAKGASRHRLTGVPAGSDRAVRWVVHTGIATVPGGRFEPSRPVRRGAAAAMVDRLRTELAIQAWNGVNAGWFPPELPTLEGHRTRAYLWRMGRAFGQDDLTPANAVVGAEVHGARLEVEYCGGVCSHLTFRMPEGYGRVRPGYYPDVDYLDGSDGFVFLYDDAYASPIYDGWLAIDDLRVGADGEVERLHLRFLLGGELVWGEVVIDADDPTVPPWPVPIPADTWAPATPPGPERPTLVGEWNTSGAHAGLASYSPADADLTWEVIGRGGVSARVDPDDTRPAWRIEVAPSYHADRLAPGWYPASSGVGHRPSDAFLRLTFGGTSDNLREGFVAVDSIRYDGDGRLAQLSVRFGGRLGRLVLRGELHLGDDLDGG